MKSGKKSASVAALLISSLVLISTLKPRPTQAHIAPKARDAIGLIAEANRLSWLGNWYGAGPLYLEAEHDFHVRGDLANEVYARIGRIRAQAAVIPFDQSIALLNDELGSPIVKSDPKLRIWCLAQKGYLELESNSHSAKQAWTEALDIATKTGQTDWAARARGELGIIAFLEGNTAAAVSLLGKGILSAYRTGDIASQVRLVSMLGNGFNEERRFAEALTMFRHAITTAEETPDAGFPFLSYNGAAAALVGLHRCDEAKRLLNQALDRAQAQNSRVQEAELLVQLGEIEQSDEGRLEEAKADFARAGQIATKMALTRTVAMAMFDLATVDRQLGDVQDESRALKTGLEASRRVGDRYYVPRDLTALAELQVAEKKFRAADRMFEQAEDVLDGILIHQHSFEESTSRVGSMSNTYLAHFRLAQQTGDVARAFKVLERVRGRTVASQMYAHDKTNRSSPALTALESEIASTQLALLRTDDARQRAVLLEQLVADERNLAFTRNEDGLHRQEELAKPASLNDIQAVMNDNELVAEYVLAEPNAYCFVITHKTAKLLVLPVGSARIQALADSFLSELRSRKSGEQRARDIYDGLIAPITDIFQKHRLIISPDGILHSIPFEALRDQNGFLVQSKVISYTPSASVLWRLRTTPVLESPRPLLAVGAVEYKLVRTFANRVERGSVAAAIVRGIAGISGSRLEDLPASRDEVLAIARIAGPKTELLLGQNATESAFKTQPLADFRVIHFATHATADPEYPDRAALFLGVAPNTAEDGLLQVREIMRLSLRADLVTLSACDTNVGTAEGEAGVVNLEQAFLIAGSRAVVASLWNVEDRSTTALMKAFYSHLANHEEKDLALAHAKRDILNQYGDTSPYYWAPFVMAGDGAGTVSFGR